MAMTAAEMVAEARSRVPTVTPDEAAAEIAGGEVLVVDVRELVERHEGGGLPGSISAPRGTLEFLADPASPHHDAEFRTDRRTIVYCVAGGRSALATASLLDLGFTDVALLEGGMTAWMDSGRPLEG